MSKTAWDEDDVDVGFLGSLILLAYMIFKDTKKYRSLSPPPPPKNIENNN